MLSTLWVYHIKYKEYGFIDCFKAHLVAKGFTQVSRVDYDKTLNLVVKLTNIHLIITLSFSFNWSMRQLDIKKCILAWVSKGDSLHRATLGFIDYLFLDYVCLLKKTLYGLKQTPCALFDFLPQCYPQLGFYCSKANSSLFIYHTQDIIAILLIYMDDVLIAGNNNQFMQVSFGNLVMNLRLKILTLYMIFLV